MTRKRLIVGVVIIFAGLLVLPFLVPLGFLVPRIEQAASQALRDQVKVGSLRAFLFPYPHLTISDVEVGAAPHLKVRKVDVVPQMLSLLDEQKVIREVSLRDIVVRQPFVEKAAALASRPASGAPAPVRVERIEVRDADVQLEGFRLQQINLFLELNPEGGLATAQLRAERGALKFDLVPRGREFAVALQVRNWKLPAGHPLMVSSLNARGMLDARGLKLPEISGRFYDGSVQGNLAIRWKPGFSVSGKLDVKQVDIKPLVAVFSRQTTLSGRLSATPAIDLRAESAAQAMHALRIDSPFTIENGVLHDFDLTAAPKALINKEALKGGDTRFDQFTGYFIADATGYHLLDMRIASGVLKAEGEVSIAPDLKLNGIIDASVKGTSALVSTPLAIGGTVQDPTIYPSKAAIAGAAAGTALLGPGLGTTAGMKVMRLTDKLFGKKKRDPRKPATEDDGAAKSTATGSAAGANGPAKTPSTTSTPVQDRGRR